ncbi:hypothetical protein KSP40_PGU007635 [Platanthera guangdongensis]|uniref:Uncharacterized protein n=1 Tax=Platanthera guangdongensis TaxID=2320717 RepID=A0ABR2N0D0_9ASPA
MALLEFFRFRVYSVGPKITLKPERDGGRNGADQEPFPPYSGDINLSPSLIFAAQTSSPDGTNRSFSRDSTILRRRQKLQPHDSCTSSKDFRPDKEEKQVKPNFLDILKNEESLLVEEEQDSDFEPVKKKMRTEVNEFDEQADLELKTEIEDCVKSTEEQRLASKIEKNCRRKLEEI